MEKGLDKNDNVSSFSNGHDEVRAKDIKAIEEQQKRFEKKEEEDIKSMAKCKILDLGYKSKNINNITSHLKIS